MSLQKKLKKINKIPSTYEKDHPLFAEANERYCYTQPVGRAVGSAKRAASQVATGGDPNNSCKVKKDDLTDGNTDPSKTEIFSKPINDQEAINSLIEGDMSLIIQSNPKCFITLSMKPCFNGDWGSYDRDFQVARLFKRAAVLIYKLFIELNPKLKSVAYRDWPFFFGTMEHFDAEGNLVAPHIHILVESDADIETISAIVERIWKRLVEDAGPSGADIQVIEKMDIERRASYVLKHSHRDGMEELWAGIKPHEVCAKFGWSHDAISHDKWRLNRDTFYSALNRRHNVLEYGNPSRRIDQGLVRIFGKIDEEEKNNLKEYLRQNGHMDDSSINNIKLYLEGNQGIGKRLLIRERQKSEGRDTM